MDLSFETTQTEQQRGRRHQVARPPPGRATPPLHLLVHHQPSIKGPRRSPWPKNPLYKGPRRVSWKRRRVYQKHRIQPEPATIGGELSSIAAQGEISTPPRSRTSSPWWEGSSPPLDYGFVEVAWWISLLFFIVLDPHELPKMIVDIFVIPLWWISFLWVDILDLNPLLFEMY